MRCCFILAFFSHVIQSLEITAAQDDSSNDDDYSKPVVRDLSARYRDRLEIGPKVA